MKFTITKKEAENIVRNHFNLPDTVSIEVAAPTFPDGYEKFGMNFGHGEIAGGRKIDAIKALRDITGLGLAGAKYAVENWPKVDAYVQAHKEWPSKDSRGDFVV